MCFLSRSSRNKTTDSVTVNFITLQAVECTEVHV